MILADKIMELRKQNGWSQEELAEKMDVSRQSVSKWEGAQSVPDLDKIIRLSQLFGVSTDYLLKDEVEDMGTMVDVYQPDTGRKVSVEEANDFIEKSQKTSVMVAIGVMLCILSPTVLIFLAAVSETNIISENLAAGIGIVVLLLMIAIGVVLFVVSGSVMAPYDFIETEELVLSYGVESITEDRMKKGQQKRTAIQCVAIVLCILCSLPLIVSSFLTENPVIICGMVDVLLGLVSIAVFLFVVSSGEKDACKKLLQREDYTKENKRINKKMEALQSIYWCLITAVYLGWSFITSDWHITWIIWPVAGVLDGVIHAITKLIWQDKEV